MEALQWRSLGRQSGQSALLEVSAMDIWREESEAMEWRNHERLSGQSALPGG